MENHETDLRDAFQKAETLFQLLEEWHPAKSDRLQSSIDKTKEEKEKEKLIRLKGLLSQYHFDETGKRSRYWNNFLHILNQTVQDLIFSLKDSSQQIRPANILEHLKKNIDQDYVVQFNSRAAQNELSYEAVFRRVSKRFAGKELRPPASAKERHDFTHGNRDSLKAWLKSHAAKEWRTEVEEKLAYYREHYQMNAYNDVLKFVTKDMHETLMGIVPNNLLQLLESWQPDWPINNADIAMMHDLQWEDELTLGVGNVWVSPEIRAKFEPETYKKIRNFLAYECENIYHLNRGAALLALIFPDYNDFTKYVLRKASYDPEEQDLNLASLYDTSGFDFQDNDYTAWGELLLDQGADNFFYLKTAHLLDNIPRNDKGKILIGRLDYQLYNRVAELLSFLSDEDIERYSSLKIVDAVARIRAFKKECEASIANKADRMVGLSDITIDGSRFGKPGYSFGRLSYNDDRFFVVGRFTNSCEYMGGQWEATVKEGYQRRNSTYYCLFDPAGRIIAHTWVYVDAKALEGTPRVILDGFEADQNDETVSKDLLEKIVAELNKESGSRKFEVGTSALHLKYEGISTIRRDELDPTAVKIVGEDELFDVDRILDKAGIAPMPSIIHVPDKQNDPEPS